MTEFKSLFLLQFLSIISLFITFSFSVSISSIAISKDLVSVLKIFLGITFTSGPTSIPFVFANANWLAGTDTHDSSSNSQFFKVVMPDSLSNSNSPTYS